MKAFMKKCGSAFHTYVVYPFHLNMNVLNKDKMNIYSFVL